MCLYTWLRLLRAAFWSTIPHFPLKALSGIGRCLRGLLRYLNKSIHSYFEFPILRNNLRYAVPNTC